MALLDSLPARALTPAELAALNRADAVEMAVPVEEAPDPDPDADSERDGADGGAATDEPTDSLLLATDDWVKGLAFEADEGGWRVVETVSLDGVERFDALRSCEEAVRFHRSTGGSATE